MSAALMKIGHVCLARGVGAAQQQALHLMRNLASMGVEQLLICRDDSPLIRQVKGTPFLKIIKIHGVTDPRFTGHFAVLRKIQLLLAHDQHGLNWVFVHFLFTGVPYLPCLHEPQLPASALYGKALFSWAQAVVCSTQSSALALKQSYGITAQLISNCVNDLKPFAPRVQRLKEQFAGRLVIGQAAPLINRRYGQSIIIDAARAVIKSIPDLLVLLIGDGNDLALLKEKAVDLPNIKFISLSGGARAADYIAALDIYVSPVKEGDEYTEQTLLDVLDLNIPVVTTRLDGVSDFISHGDNGYVIEPNAQALADALLYLRGHRAVLPLLAKGGRRTADEHRPEQMALAYYQLLRRELKI